jgi:MFS family permease
VALPDTQRTLHAGPSAIQFIVAGYGLALAAGLITAGRLGDLYGRRRMYVLGLCLFTLAATAAGVLSTAQQAGGAIGVAVIGVVFYHTLGGGSYAHAFQAGLEVMAALGLVVAALVQLLPRSS